MAWLDPIRLFCLLVSAVCGGIGGAGIGLVMGGVAGVTDVRLSAPCGGAVGMVVCLVLAARSLRGELTNGP
jgi:hypothetical protein